MLINTIKKSSKLVIAYLPAFILTIAYLLFQYLFSNLSKTVSPSQTILSFVFFYFILAIIGFLANKVLKNHTKAGLVLYIIAELFLFSQAFFIASGIISVVLILIWAWVTHIRKKTLSLNYISHFMSVLGVELIIIVLVLSPSSLPIYFNGTPQIIEPSKSELVLSESPPDIYYIVLDAYTRPDVLEELFGFNNSDFINSLTEKGFYIPIENHSNYDRSELSEAATLNMQYINTLIPNAEDNWSHLWLLSPLIENSTVKKMLQEADYKSISIAVDYETINDDNVDIYFQPLPIRLNSFEKHLIQTSPIRILSPIIGKFAMINTYSSHRELINFSFTKLSEISEIEGPKFIYTHIMSPHPPFVFNKFGQPVEPSYEYSLIDGLDFPGTKEQYKTGYINQLQYINHKLDKTIDSILDRSETPPIIIIMSDHGSRLYRDFSNSENTCISEANSNFMAFYLPGMKPDDIPSDLTSVNVFRLIFNNYFHTDFHLLENRYYLSDEEKIKDVGKSINMECDVSP